MEHGHGPPLYRVDEPLGLAELPDDCLVHILLHLPLHERLRLERVAAKWYMLMPYYDVRAFAMDQLRWRNRHVYDLEYRSNNLTHCQKAMRTKWLQRYMETLLYRFGASLRMLKLSSDAFRPIVTDELLETIAECAPNLRHLSIGNSIVHVQAVETLKKLPHLTVLNAQNAIYLDAESSQPPADYTELANSMESTLRRFAPQMTAVNFSHFPVTLRMELPRLQKAFLDFTPIDDLGLEALAHNCPNLDTVCLSNCRTVTRFLPLAGLQMKSLLLNGTKVNDGDLRDIVQAQTALTCLRVDNCQNVRRFHCLRSLSRLDSLWVGPSAGFGDADLARLGKHGRLRNVVVSGCQVTDAGLRYLATHCGRLSELSVCHTTVTDEGVRCVLAECGELRLLNVQSTNVGNATVASLGSAPATLQCVYLQNCQEISESGFTALLHARAQHNSAGRLMVMAGGYGSLSIADHVVEALRRAGVGLHVQLPLLALPYVQD